MSEPTHQLALFLPGHRTAFRPGERIDVAVLWAFDRPPQSLEVRLFWFTRGKGTGDVAIVERQVVPVPAAAGEHTLAFTLPEAPWSFSGKLISLTWAFEVLAGPGEHCARAEFALGPAGREILLHATADASRA